MENINKGFNGNQIYINFSLTISEGIITCILGPSGCGKTTLLNIIGGIILPDGGIMSGFEDKVMSYIFQDPRLLLWKTVRGNIEFVMDRKLSVSERRDNTDRLIRLVGLEGFEDYYPSRLSGGMRQRVSIARAFACSSDLILMDEPLKGLDISLKQTLMRSFSRIWKNDRRTVIFVTHDIDEALMLGEEIVILSHPPVAIKARHTFSEAHENRRPDTREFNDLKQKIIDVIK